jgi:hypothetical protein
VHCNAIKISPTEKSSVSGVEDHASSSDTEMTSNDWVSTEMNFGPDSWDDSTILDIFDDAIRSHKTKKDKVSFILSSLPHHPLHVSLIFEITRTA